MVHEELVYVLVLACCGLSLLASVVLVSNKSISISI